MVFWPEDKDAVEVRPNIEPATTTTRKFFQAGNPQMGKPATVVEAFFLNMLFEELVNAVEYAGITPDKQNNAQLATAMAMSGIAEWRKTFTYDPLPWLAWGSDDMIYVAIQPSGPGVENVGPKDPTTTKGYWMSLGQWVRAAATPTQAQTFYVRSDGDDDNSGLEDNAEGAFKSIQGALNQIQSRQFTSPYDVTIRVGAGRYGEALSIPADIITSGVLYIVGAGYSDEEGATRVTSPVNNFSVSITSGRAQCSNMLFSGSQTSTTMTYAAAHASSGGSLILNNCYLYFDDNGTSRGSIITVNGGAVTLYATIEIGGTVARYLYGYNGTINIGTTTNSCQFVFMGLTASGAGILCTNGSLITILTSSFSVSGAGKAIIGTRFNVNLHGIINASGYGVNIFPGSAAGVIGTATYGIYLS